MAIVLWDIDGTLVRGKGGRVSVKAFTRALQRACRLEPQLVYPENAAGMTDRGIVLQVLAAASLGDEAALEVLEAFGPAYVEEMERGREDLRADLLVLPGVPQVLRRLHELGIKQSLLTGNLQPIARFKLVLVGLDQYLDFDIGAFGSDHHDRNCLVPIVRERARRKYGETAAAESIVVVGDTPRDIACARAGGVRVVAVATGNSSRQELESHSPDTVLDDLADTENVVKTLLRYSSFSDSTDQQALIV